ncbi:MAG: hypothetical protein ACYCS8_06770 [Acidithiobacillus sp.]
MITRKLTCSWQDQQSPKHHSAAGAARMASSGGDEMAYRVEDGRVLLSKATPEAEEDPFALFAEWDREADWRAYGQL